MFYIGLAVLFGSVFLGYLAIGGNLMVLLHPSEWVIILGAAIGSYIIANPKTVIVDMFKSLKILNRTSPYTKNDYLELLSFMFGFFKFVHSNGMIEVENHIENPQKSELFTKFKIMKKNSEAITFFSDYFRVVALGFDNSMELENMMDNDLESRKNHSDSISSSLVKTADALPALGIVAAVLGVITAMASVGGEPAVLGKKIASALVGTFIGAFTSYGLIGPIAFFIAKYKSEEIHFLECIKSAIIAHMNGCAPSVCIEFARQVIPKAYKPSFSEVENKIDQISR